MTLTDKTVLIIDNHPVYSQKIEGFLKSLTFHNVHIAATGEEGIRKSSDVRPDLVILSSRLPDMDSAEVCIHLKAGMPAIKILVQTGLISETYEVQRFMTSGADRTLPRREKDLNPLRQMIEEVFT